MGTVLNLVISGIPSIPINQQFALLNAAGGFKPCYKWNTFNTSNHVMGVNQLDEF